MSKLIDLSGEQIGLWKVLRRCDPPEGKKGTWWLCECQCEAKTVRPVAGGNLATYKKNPPKGSGSCGCVGAEKIGNRQRSHGMSKTPTYYAWLAAIKRCSNPNDKSYPDYGGREHKPRTVCSRWRTSFESFLSGMGVRPDNTELDRIDNGGSYTCGKPECPECGPQGLPSNCQWSTKADNLRNRQDIDRYLYKGEMLTCGQIVERTGIPITAAGLKDRIHRLGLTVEEALVLPIKQRKMKHTYQGEEWTTSELEALCGIPAAQIGKRINSYGWTVERAISQPIKEGMGIPKTLQWEGREWTLSQLSTYCGVSTKQLHARLFLYHWPIEKAIQEKDFRKE